MVDARNDRAAALVVLDEMPLPEGMCAAQRRDGQHADALLQCGALALPAPALQALAHDVALEREVLVVDPAVAERILDDLLPEARVAEQSLAQPLAERLVADCRLEQPDADDRHQVDVAVHAQPRGVHARHAFGRWHGGSPLGSFVRGQCGLRCRTSIVIVTEEMSMADLKAAFEKAVADSKNLPERPDNQTLLKIYALYKQATAGDVEGKRPGFTDMVGRAKWDAWNELKGKDAKSAMKEYVDLIESLK
jgi:diazepam-binding inhibitor (GABA receptor modulating acyl-CoA-binding protein)